MIHKPVGTVVARSVETLLHHADLYESATPENDAWRDELLASLHKEAEWWVRTPAQKEVFLGLVLDWVREFPCPDYLSCWGWGADPVSLLAEFASAARRLA